MEALIIILVGAALATGALVLIYIVLLTLAIIVDWFNEQLALVDNDEDMIAFTVSQAMKDGKANVIQGVLDRSIGKLEAVRKIETGNVSNEIKSAHKGHEVVIYN